MRPRNAAQQLPTVPAVILLHDDATGLPLCVMEATYLTGLRWVLHCAVSYVRVCAVSLLELNRPAPVNGHSNSCLFFHSLFHCHYLLTLFAGRRPDQPWPQTAWPQRQPAASSSLAQACRRACTSWPSRACGPSRMVG